MTKVVPQSKDTSYGHNPVLLTEVIQVLQPTTGKTYVDATLGAGGHAEALLAHTEPDGLVYGIDQDPVALSIANERLQRFGTRFSPLQGNFSDIQRLLPFSALPISGGILADIGVSSMQIDTSERGFSFNKDAPLDMRMSPINLLTAAQIVNTYAEDDLVRIFSEYGEEHLSKTIARKLVEQRLNRPFEGTQQLAHCIAQIYQTRGKQEKIHPATRVFQALRIEVNDELGHLKRFLEVLPNILASDARVAIISFHSLEDRIVKQFFQEQSQDCICPPRFPVCQCNHRATFKILTKKPVQASSAEIAMNPRSRSAKLRAAVRI